MPRKPKPCPVADDDELFHFVGVTFNVTRAKAIVADGRKVDEVAMNDLSAYLPAEDPNRLKLCVFVDREVAMTTDPNEPGIVAYVRLSSGEYELMMIDGWHRAYKARHEGKEEFPVRLLTKEESDKVRVR